VCSRSEGLKKWKTGSVLQTKAGVEKRHRAKGGKETEKNVESHRKKMQKGPLRFASESGESSSPEEGERLESASVLFLGRMHDEKQGALYRT